MTGEIPREEILLSLRDLAFGKINDAVKLAFMEEATPAAIGKLDLRGLSELHRLSNGTVDMKFIDRAKLIELLLSATEEKSDPSAAAAGLISAINTAAGRLPGQTDGAADQPDVP